MSSFLLAEQLPKLQKQAERVGVDMRYVVNPYLTDRTEHFEHRADEPIFGASVGKLAVAHAVIAMLNPMSDVVITRHVKGSGQYDKLMAVGMRVPVHKLQKDMLQHSGNAAFAMLADEIGGADVLNTFYDSEGWEKTRVVSDEAGRTLLNTTTPHEALDQIEKLIAMRDEGYLQAVTVDALRNSQATHGNVRMIISSYKGVNIINKHGSYPGDKEDPFEFRHDVGVIGTETERIGYALMTRSAMNAKGSMASLAVQQFGLELARTLGAEGSLKRSVKLTGRVRRLF